MSVIPSPGLNEHPEQLSSQSSDEKMDTGSESLLSAQDTPNSVSSSEFDEKHHNQDEETVLRLQNPKHNDPSVLRLSKPADISNEFDNSLVNKMSTLFKTLDVEEIRKRPINLGISPPKFSSTLTSTTDHPLMGLGSPDSSENYPDVVPKKALKKTEDDTKDLSLSSIEDERIANESNGYSEYYGPQRNTSKNNLYYHENFVTAESQFLCDVTSPPDVARVERSESARRRIIPLLKEEGSTPQRSLARVPDSVSDSVPDSAGVGGWRRDMVKAESTPNRADGGSMALDIPEAEIEEFHSGVAEWCESPSHLRSMPNFDLPIEMKSNVCTQQYDADTPDVTSAASDDKSCYRAHIDVCGGRVSLTQRHTSPLPAPPAPGGMRRRIQLPIEDSCSLDSESACSLDSDEEPAPSLQPRSPPCSLPSSPPGSPAHHTHSAEDDEASKRTSLSSSSSYIPELSAAEEAAEAAHSRAWLRVTLPPPRGDVNCDMRVIEPFKRVLSHGGYSSDSALLVFSACHLPDTARPDYRYVMDNLFLYTVWSVSRLVTSSYCVVYLHGGSRGKPAFSWLRDAHKMLDRRLRKNMKRLYLVHPTFWLKSIVVLSKPFVSSKFFKKLTYVKNLDELMELVPVEPNAIPDLVKQYDAKLR